MIVCPRSACVVPFQLPSWLRAFAPVALVVRGHRTNLSPAFTLFVSPPPDSRHGTNARIAAQAVTRVHRKHARPRANGAS